MATKKKKTGKKTDEEKAALKAKLDHLLESYSGELKDTESAPEGFVKAQGDIIGTWVRCSPIQGVALHAKLMDSRLEPQKSAALIFVELTKPCVVEDGEGEFALAQPGDTVGIWYKAGMRELRWLRNAEFWMNESGTKDTGKGNEMITFDVHYKERGEPMLILEDFREDSAPFVDGRGKTVGLHDLEPKQNALQKVPI